jgi:hypothetical protein
VKIDVETGGVREEVQNLTEATDLGVFSSQNQQGIIGVLDHGAWEIVDKGMQKTVTAPFHGDEAGEQVSDGQVQVGGQRISLA